MNWIPVIVLVALVFILAAIFGSKASAPSLFEGILFLLGFSSVILVSTDRWIDGINWIVNNSRTLFGMADKKFDFSETISAMKAGEISKTTAGTITISGVLAIGAIRMFTSVLALLIGFILGIITKVWMKYYNIGFSGLI